MSGPRGATPTSKKRHDVHLDVAQHGGAQHADELGLACRAERDEHPLDPVGHDDAVEVVDVAEQRTRQSRVVRTDETGELEAVLGVHGHEVGELDADVTGAGDDGRLEQAAPAGAAKERVAERARRDDEHDRDPGLPQKP